MANKLDIRTGANQTTVVSKFVVASNGTVTIHNDANGAASISFIGPSPLCNGGPPQTLVSLAGGASKTFNICPGADGQTFQFRTMIGTTTEKPNNLLVSGLTTTECPIVSSPSTTPIVIFEREVPIGLVALVFGVVIGYAIAKLVGRQKV